MWVWYSVHAAGNGKKDLRTGNGRQFSTKSWKCQKLGTYQLVQDVTPNTSSLYHLTSYQS